VSDEGGGGEAKPESGGNPARGRIDGKRIWTHRFLDAHLDRVRFPDGSEGEQVLIHHPGASAVVPFLTDPAGDDPEILLLHQYRYATGGELWEIPAGLREANEDPAACARRELLEETGCTCQHLEAMTFLWTTPGFTDEKIHLFRAWGLTRGASAREADEFIEVVALPMSEAHRMIRAGEITDGKTLVALLVASKFSDVHS
jgi:ADP-ribose pyrophosphatase